MALKYLYYGGKTGKGKTWKGKTPERHSKIQIRNGDNQTGKRVGITYNSEMKLTISEFYVGDLYTNKTFFRKRIKYRVQVYD